jgi:type I restriction enzyme S subunit
MPIEKATLQAFSLKKWDILFNEGGDRDKLGRGWIWESKVSPCITQNHVFRASLYRTGEKEAKFISYWGNTFGRDYFERIGKQTTNLASINKGVLSMFPVPIASLEEQAQIDQEIESRLSVCDKLAETIDASLRQTDALRQSILKKAFDGRLLGEVELVACRAEPDWCPARELVARVKTGCQGK